MKEEEQISKERIQREYQEFLKRKKILMHLLSAFVGWVILLIGLMVLSFFNEKIFIMWEMSLVIGSLIGLVSGYLVMRYPANKKIWLLGLFLIGINITQFILFWIDYV